MTRDEHLEWAKSRALEYLNAGDLSNAVASMGSDLSKHEETRGVGKAMGPVAMVYLLNRDEKGIRDWITGFR